MDKFGKGGSRIPSKTLLDFDASGYESLPDALDGLVMFRLERMMEGPLKFASKRRDFFMQLEMLVEVSLIGMNLISEEGEPMEGVSLFSTFLKEMPDIFSDEDANAPLTVEWAKAACVVTTTFITTQFGRQAKHHDENCPHCSQGKGHEDGDDGNPSWKMN